MPMLPIKYLVDCGTINVEVPRDELEPAAANPDYLVHPTEKRGRLGWPIVIRERDGEALDPDDQGRFRIGRKLLTFDELTASQAPAACDEEE